MNWFLNWFHKSDRFAVKVIKKPQNKNILIVNSKKN